MTVEPAGNTLNQVATNAWRKAQTPPNEAPGNQVVAADSSSKPAPGLAFGPSGGASSSAPVPAPKTSLQALPPFDISGKVEKARAAFVAAIRELERASASYDHGEATSDEVNSAERKVVLAEASFKGAIFDQMARDASIIRSSDFADPTAMRIAGRRVTSFLDNDPVAADVGELAVRQMVDVRAIDVCMKTLRYSNKRDVAIKGLADWVVNGNGIDGNTRNDQSARLDRIKTALKENNVKDRDAVLAAVEAGVKQIRPDNRPVL